MHKCVLHDPMKSSIKRKDDSSERLWSSTMNYLSMSSSETWNKSTRSRTYIFVGLSRTISYAFSNREIFTKVRKKCSLSPPGVETINRI